MTNSNFFDESKEQSLVKAEIVAKYFWAWAKVIIPHAKKRDSKIAYVDLFCGPGRYKDGSKSTPLLILERALADRDMAEMLVTVFNDLNSDNTQSLQQAIDSLPDISKLRNKPTVLNEEVGEKIIKALEPIISLPTLYFIDPWGYKGLSLNLIASSIMNWGCDCLFFFNYNRINMGLNNAAVEEHMNALFGKERSDRLRQQLQFIEPYQRELTIVENLCEALKEIGGTYPLPFRFKNDEGTRTSHHLIFVSKNVLGYSIMKEIMAKESSSSEQGVSCFEYNPATNYYPLLFELAQPLDELENMLLNDFAGCILRMEDIYNKHHVGRRYIKKNYKDALLKLEQQGRITANPSSPPRRRNTFGDDVIVTFPPKL